MSGDFDSSHKSAMGKLDKALSNLSKTLKSYIPKNMPKMAKSDGETDTTPKTKTGKVPHRLQLQARESHKSGKSG